MMTEFKRVKHGQQPGDIPKQAKILLRERCVPVRLFPWQILTSACAKEFRLYLRDKGRTVQRRRDKRACLEGIDDIFV